MRSVAQIRHARPEEAGAISALALRSKGHWGYSQEFLEACRAELTYSTEDCASGNVVVAERDGSLLGFYALGGSPPHGELAALFVDLDNIGRGMGAYLLQHALRTAASRGFETLTLDADPGAELFYVRHGAVRISEVASGSLPGRVLPQLQFKLSR